VLIPAHHGLNRPQLSRHFRGCGCGQ